MAGPRTDDQAARERVKREFEEAQRRMADELGDAVPPVTSEEDADRVAVEWELNDPPVRPARDPNA
jgi:hypothetical protein